MSYFPSAYFGPSYYGAYWQGDPGGGVQPAQEDTAAQQPIPGGALSTRRRPPVRVTREPMPRDHVEIRIAFDGTSDARVLDRPLIIEIGVAFRQQTSMRVLLETTGMDLDPALFDAEDDDAIVFAFVTQFLSHYAANGEAVDAILA